MNLGPVFMKSYLNSNHYHERSKHLGLRFNMVLGSPLIGPAKMYVGSFLCQKSSIYVVNGYTSVLRSCPWYTSFVLSFGLRLVTLDMVRL